MISESAWRVLLFMAAMGVVGVIAALVWIAKAILWLAEHVTIQF